MSRGLGKLQRRFLDAMVEFERQRKEPSVIPIWQLFAMDNGVCKDFKPERLFTKPAAPGLRGECFTESMNPSRVLASLEQRGLIRRVGPNAVGSAVYLTATGRKVAGSPFSNPLWAA